MNPFGSAILLGLDICDALPHDKLRNNVTISLLQIVLCMSMQADKNRDGSLCNETFSKYKLYKTNYFLASIYLKMMLSHEYRRTVEKDKDLLNQNQQD